ncbi:type II secretion system minor pseudopilin GspK [Parvularcula oceani]|uniref:type II secretion system minor pseudopilin GspK n=1 Tax=Parvularcula oceani TaxID=1247963 RepID=UPI0005657CDD|nr:type II secretion system minor pseudopilin GspK [Parvularcula oceani]
MRVAREEERGIALLVVLLLLANLAVVAVATTEVMTRSVARTGAAQARDRAVWALLGAEQAGALVLEQALQDEAAQQTLGDPLFAAPVTLSLPGATIEGRFEDRSACFNLNDLVDGPPGAYVTNEAGVARFGDLIESMGGNRPQGTLLAEAVADFADSDDAPNPGGSEDYDYSRGTPPYRTAGTLLSDVSELRAIRGWSAELYAALGPHLCALPRTGPARLNVNMLAPQDAPVLHALLDRQVPMGEVERLVANPPPGGYGTVEAFLSQGALANASLPDEALAGLSTKSSLVSLTASAVEGGQELSMTTLFYIDGGTARPIARRFGGAP